MAFNEHDIVHAVIDVERQDCTVKKGDVGTIVHIYEQGKSLHNPPAYEVEFIREDTSDVVTMYPHELEAA